MNAWIDREFPEHAPKVSAPSWQRTPNADRPGRRTDSPAVTGCLLAAALAAMGVVLVIDTAEKVWRWLDARAARLLDRPTGRVVSTFDGRRP